MCHIIVQLSCDVRTSSLEKSAIAHTIDMVGGLAPGRTQRSGGSAQASSYNDHYLYYLDLYPIGSTIVAWCACAERWVSYYDKSPMSKLISYSCKKDVQCRSTTFYSRIWTLKMADSDVCKCKNLLCEIYTSKHDTILIVSSEGCSTIVMWVLCRWFGLAALNYSVKVQT